MTRHLKNDLELLPSFVAFGTRDPRNNGLAEQLLFGVLLRDDQL
jgi:hypothetical protein